MLAELKPDLKAQEEAIPVLRRDHPDEQIAEFQSHVGETSRVLRMPLDTPGTEARPHRFVQAHFGSTADSWD